MRNRLSACLLACVLAFVPILAHAQSAYTKQAQIWFPVAKISGGISVGGATASTALPATGSNAWVCNTGAADAYLSFGTTSGVTTSLTTGSWLKSATCATYDMQPVGTRYTFVATISPTSTTLTLETGLGTGPTQLAASGGGGGGSVTQGTSPWVVAGATAVGSAAVVAPNLIGGTADGSATGAVGMLKVLGGLAFMNCANCSGSGVSAVDTATMVPGTSLLAPSGGFFQTTATNNPLTNLQQGTVQLTANRAFFVNPRNSSGVEIGTAGAPIRIDPTGTTTQPVSLISTTITGTVAATQSGAWTVNPTTIGNWGLAASTQNVPTATNGMLAMGEFNTTPTTITSGNSSPLQLDSAGKLIVNCATGCAGGGGGAITAASGAFASGSISSGAMVDLGTIADATAAVGGAGTLSAKLRLMTSQLDSINTNISGPTPAGTNVIGALSANQSVNVAQFNGVTPLMGNGVSGTGSQRVNIASDNSPIPTTSNDYTTMPPGTSSPLAVPGQGVFAGVPYRLYDKGNAPTGTGTNTCSASCFGVTAFTGDFSDYAEISIQMTSIGVGGAISFYESNDNFAATANLAQCVQRSSNGATSPITTTQNSLGLVTCKIGARYFRAVFTSYTSGTYTVFWAAGKETGTSNVQPVYLAGSPDLGFVLDTAATVGSTGSLNAKLRLMTSQLDTLNTNVTASIPAGTAVIGKVGIDQTTPGTTNLVALAANQSVNVAQFNGVTPLMGNGIAGTGAQRVTIASDNTAFSTNAIQSGTWTMQPGNTANTTPWLESISQGGNTAVVKAASTPSPATDPSLSVTINAGSNGLITLGPATIANSVPTIPSSQYPGNATAAANPITGNATGTTGAVVGTLAGVASKTTFICGFSVDAVGGTASAGPITIAGLVGSSMVFQLFSSATGAVREKTFSPCIPASAANTAITVTTTAAAGATAVDVNSYGYQL